ncbi:hypothetical protein [Raineyella sp. LH-20]|uniref:hypothetical protein n=1 Tax=Raineyella sp. LH-20 TaxID=3081204 RepID=UPI002954BECD|nr:hypothetical protein [Raineyella sp. LH-20]WOP19001.1 hypothetical protein R0146_01595 [Raineyella sp. LH-20]
MDCARTLGFADGLAVVDSALRLAFGRCTKEQLVGVLRAQGGRHGIAIARAVVAGASPLAENGGESVSRALLKQQGLPDPVLQYEIRNENGEFVARTDLAWLEARTVGEFDGVQKYRRGQDDQDAGRIVYQEKRREDAIRSLGWEVVRWGWDDLDDSAALAARIRTAMRRRAGAYVTRPRTA